MCGIIGYVGRKKALPMLLDGLQRLEYRGYDSVGVALINGRGLEVFKKAGKVSELVKLIGNSGGESDPATIGIGHTRWATHGEPNDQNAHPHWDCAKEIALIHNGIIENYS